MAPANNPKFHLKTPTFRSGGEDIEACAASSSTENAEGKRASQRHSTLRSKATKRLRTADSPNHPATGNDVYLGSYAHSFRASIDARSQGHPVGPSPRTSISHLQLDHLLQAVDRELETYGVEELRDGFFDASFHRPMKQDHEDLMQRASMSLPDSFKQKNHPLSVRHFLPQQLRDVRSFLLRISTSRAGIRLLKSFLGFFVTYIICLIPASKDWLGRYNYFMVISAIINHPGRSLGSQIDGAAMTTIGTVAGLGWGSLALYVSTSTSIARAGYGGVLAAFLVSFAVLIAWLRCVFIRFYQAILASGVAICYICLEDASQDVSWIKVFDYGIPWVLGQAVCLIISAMIFPDAGSRSLALALHDSLQTILEGLRLPHPHSPSLRQKLAFQFVKVSLSVRDFTIDFAISRFSPDDIRAVRNLIQAVDRSILAIRPDTELFDDHHSESETCSGMTRNDPPLTPFQTDRSTTRLICSCLKEPIRQVIDAMIESVKCSDAVILQIGGHNPPQLPRSLAVSLDNLRTAKVAFDSADAALVANPDLPSLYHKSPDVAELFLFIHPVRQTADKVEQLAAKILEMQSTNKSWKIRPPSYPLHKTIMRANAQVRHDRGGLTAGFYFRSKRQLDRTMADLQSTAYVPAGRDQAIGQDLNLNSALGEYQLEQQFASGKSPDVPRVVKYRFRLWKVLHRLQGFESRFAFKVTLVSTLLSVPAWLPQSRDWWTRYESWWAVATLWIMMHPRVGGTLQDLTVRTFCAVIGAVWGGLAYAAKDGNPYVMAVFAAIYMIPMLYRFTQSSHPRSGGIGCISFTVVSLRAYTDGGNPSIVNIAWTRGLAFVVGVVVALVVNWVLWPFIARHELRKSLSAMMLHSAILYRGVIAKYVYHDEGQEPGPEDIARSEMLEGRLREGFVRMRQLLELTRHEIRLRAPFDPAPYSALITACVSFFEHLVQVRQSSLYFQPSMQASDPAVVASLMAPRRDAVAVILLNLYVLASALRADQPVPRYLPSAAAARRKVLDRMDVLEAEQASRAEAQGMDVRGGDRQRRRWADVYQYAFSGALTDIVEELQEMQMYTKEICGEVEWEGDQFLEE